MSDNINSLLSSLEINAINEFVDDVKKCLIAENLVPDEQITGFFEAIYSAAISLEENTFINKVLADDKEIVRTFSDLYKKHEYLFAKDNSSLTISDIPKVAAEYLASIDILPQKLSKDDTRKKTTISDKDGNRLFSAAFDKKSPLPYGYARSSVANATELASDGTRLILLEGDAPNYDALCGNPLFKDYCINRAEIDSRGLVYAILSISSGAFIDIPDNFELKDLVLSCHGEKIIAVADENLDKALALAEEYGLSARQIATATATPCIRFNYLSDTVNLRAGFLRRLFKYKKSFVAKCPAELFAPTEYIPLFCEDTELDNTVLCDTHILSARCTKQCSFVNGINTVLDSIFSLLSKGIDRRRISISLNISANAQNASSAFAAMLGAYRVVMELCLPIGSSSISFSDNEHIFCAAYAENDSCGGMTSTEELDNLYLLSFKRFSNTSPELMPDFEEIRKMCDFLYSSISSGAFGSVSPVNGSANSAANAICPTGYELVTIKEDGITESTYSQGFIVQARPDIILNAPRIGFIKAKIATEQNTEE